MKRTIFILFTLAFTFSLHAQVQLSEQARISIITVSPWDGAVYAMYGHTAVRVQDPVLTIDWVFNYGYFDNSQPNFLFNFARGVASYSVEIQQFRHFLWRYEMNGLEAIEQVLDLVQEETQNLFNAMYISALPENRYYLYDFFFDNCVTRPRDMLERYVPGMRFPDDHRQQTFRNLIHECVSPFPWVQFGIDLVIGSGADSIISLRNKMFIPRYFKEALAETVVIRDGVAMPFVTETNVLLEKVVEDTERRRRFLIPIVIMIILLLDTIAISWWQHANGSKSVLFKVYDTFLFTVIGLGGIVIFFLMYFSIHPAVNPNWNLLWMNPLALIAAVLFWVKPAQKFVHYYHVANFIVLSLFLLFMWLIPQWFNPAIIPLVLCIWLRAGMNGYIQRNELKKL